jgi:single-stranded-DNA-specific exonuclease
MGAWDWREASDWSERAERLRGRHGVSSVLAMLLSQRPFEDAEVDAFLDPELVPWPDPARLPEAAEAAARIARAAESGEAVMIHGDYDVDGLMGTAVLMGGLKSLGAKVEAFVPSRFDGGYGLSETSLEAVKRAGASLLVTTDCGTNAREIGERLRDAGIDLIVTDHHLPDPGERPPGIVVNPKADAGHPDRDLCGAAVALQVLRCTAAQMGKDLPLEPFLRLVAIATVADVVPVTAVNRKICKAGFQALEHTPNPGLALLLEDILRMGPVRSHHISYHIAPRFNAAGRMEDARLVLDLLLERDPAAAARLKGRLESLNDQRKSYQVAAYEEALEQARQVPEESRVIVAASGNWHKGIIGPVAARLAETFKKSAFVLCVEGDVAVGSGRAWKQDNVTAVLREVSDLLLRFGGHSGAAGFSVETDKIPELERRLVALPPSSQAHAHGETYFPIQPSQLEDAWRAWGLLDPFGPGNPEPYLGLSGLCARGQKTMSGGHLAWEVGVSPSQTVQFIAWNGESAGLGPSSLAPSRTIIGRPAPQQRPGPSPYYFNVTAIL